MVDAPERIWASSVTENYGEWQTVTDGMPRPTEYVRADLVTARCSSCDGSGDVHRADGEWLGECNCGSEFRHAFDVEANPSKAYRVIRSQAARIAALEAQLAEGITYLRNLLDNFVKEHFPDNTKWRPLHDDLLGMLTQMDNASTIARDYKSRLSALEATPPAPKVTEAMVEAVQRIRKTAMRQSIVARVPECGEFGGIAQDADWLLDALTAAQEAGKP